MEIAKRYELGTYPLLLMLRYGKRYNYTGPREENGEGETCKEYGALRGPGGGWVRFDYGMCLIG